MDVVDVVDMVDVVDVVDVVERKRKPEDQREVRKNEVDGGCGGKEKKVR